MTSPIKNRECEVIEHPSDDGGCTYDIQTSSSFKSQRLDKTLADSLPSISRSLLKTYIIDGCVTLGGHVIKDPSKKVVADQSIILTKPKPIPSWMEAQEIPLTIIYEDSDLIVLDKPVGLVVHPAPGNKDMTLVNALLSHCGPGILDIGGHERPGLVHRLDKDTSGLMVVAKSQTAYTRLIDQFKDRSLSRTYHALVWGVPKPLEGTITGDIGRSPENRKKMAVVTSGGRPAVTHYKVLKHWGEACSLVECKLETGRTHQIRVHMTHKGHGIIGDPVYGRGRGFKKTVSSLILDGINGLKRQALHAVRLELHHPTLNKKMSFQSNYPADINNLLDLLNKNM